MNRQFTLRFRSLILLGLLAGLLVVTGIATVILYERLYSAIIDGFERKLFVISTVTSQAIDGDAHSKMMEKRRIRDLAVDPGTAAIFGLDANNSVIVRIDGQTGAASDLFRIPVPEARGLCWDSAHGRLLTFDKEERTLLSLDPTSGYGKVVCSLELPISRLAADPRTGAILGWSPAGMVRIDPKSGSTIPIAALDAVSLEGLCFGGPSNTLWALAGGNKEMLELNPERGTIISRRTVRRHREADVKEKILVTDAGLGPKEDFVALDGLAYRPDKREFVSAADRLVPIPVESMDACLNCFVEGFWNNDSRFYIDHVAAIREIMHKESVTYVYTQVLLSGVNIMYGLDGSEGHDHMPIGTRDVLPAKNFYDLYQKVLNGQVYITPIQEWENWGLLKSSFAPVFDSHSNIVAMAGADLNISAIRQKTGFALMNAVLIFGVSLILILFVAAYLGRAITEPIRQITSATLRMAAGNFHERIDVRGPREITALAADFSGIGSEIVRILAKLEKQERALGNKWVFNDLLSLGWANRQSGAPGGIRLEVVCRGLGSDLSNGSGAMPFRDGRLAWAAPSLGNRELAAFCASDFARIVPRLFADENLFAGAAWERLIGLFPEMSGIVWASPVARTLHGKGRSPIWVARSRRAAAMWTRNQFPEEFEIRCAQDEIVLVGFNLRSDPNEWFEALGRIPESDVSATDWIESRFESEGWRGTLSGAAWFLAFDGREQNDVE